jgi:hypothetical protein
LGFPTTFLFFSFFSFFPSCLPARPKSPSTNYLKKKIHTTNLPARIWKSIPVSFSFFFENQTSFFFESEFSHKFCYSLFAWLISHQPAVLFSQNKSAASNQQAVLFSQNKPAPAISHQPNEQALRPFK